MSFAALCGSQVWNSVIPARPRWQPLLQPGLPNFADAPWRRLPEGSSPPPSLCSSSRRHPDPDRRPERCPSAAAPCSELVFAGIVRRSGLRRCVLWKGKVAAQTGSVPIRRRSGGWRRGGGGFCCAHAATLNPRSKQRYKCGRPGMPLFYRRYWIVWKQFCSSSCERRSCQQKSRPLKGEALSGLVGEVLRGRRS